MKKMLAPILILLGLVVLLALAMFWYEQKWGSDGPFPSHHHHGPNGEEQTE